MFYLLASATDSRLLAFVAAIVLIGLLKVQESVLHSLLKVQENMQNPQSVTSWSHIFTASL